MNYQNVIEVLKQNKPTSDPRLCAKELCAACDAAISAMQELQQYWDIGTLEECRETREKQDKYIKQAIQNCFMARKYEYPGMEEGMCAGLRTIHGNGEPCEVCKDCALLYRE